MKQLHRLNDLIPFYTDRVLRDMLVPIITQKDSISLRVLDWLVTNYAKKENIAYIILLLTTD